MGSLIPGFIAEAVLKRLEAIVFQAIAQKLWKRYLDDTFAIIDKDKLSDFHLIRPFEFQFTLDKERDNGLPFLDIPVHLLPIAH